MQRAVSSQSDGGAQESAAAGQNAGQPLGNQRHPIVRVCSGTQQELAACSGLPACFSDCQPVDCAWNDWQDWYGLGGCTGLCVHDRTIKTVNNECGRPCNGSKRETIQRDDCMPSSCKVASADCTWEEWSGWSSCSSGQQYRTRGILGVPSGRGKACDGPYHQVRPCVLAPAQDCQLSEWGDWAKCSTLCGGGMQVRARRIAIHRENGGSPCSGAMSEAQMCNDVPCSSSAPECELSDWGEWKACDGLATQTARVRAVLPPEAGGVSECRLPGNASAPLQEIKPCTPNDNVARSKCELSLWSEWGACSGSCSGQRSRSRGMLGSLNDGLVCELPSDQATLEVEPCGEHSCLGGAEKCELSDWADWSPCSRMCGEGMAERSRSVTRQGPSCAVSLKDVKACSLSNCTVVDCKLGDWEQWGTCTTTCGGGLMERKRGVASLPRHGGRECEAGSMSEAAACGTQPCRTCIDGAWGQWGNWSACTGSCSPAYRVRRREVEKHPNECGKHATGLEDEYGLCAGLPPCKPDRDCELSAWSEWSACSSTCRGTRQRNRNVKVFQSGEGRKCNAESLQETSPCSPGPGEDAPEGCRAEARQSCQLAAWSPWGDCSQTCGGGQAQRSRFVLVPSDEGGEPCSDSLSEVKKCLSNPCNQSLCQDCEWEQWSDWSECPASSCAGQKYRRRAIRRAPNFCGRPCNESHSKETAPCDSTCAGEGAPAFYCAWSGWADMGGCVAECGATTRLRSRNLQLLPAVAGNGSALLTAAAALFASPGGYVACSGAQTAQEHCLLPPCDGQCEPVDCVFSDWKDWGAATDNLLCERQRDIVRMHDCGGKFCSGSLSQTERCTEGTAGLQDCVLSDWSAWEPPGACEANTQRSRKRTVELQPAGGGRACEGALQETTSCRDVPADGARADCQLGPWGEWSTCSSSCGPGTRNRARSTTLATGGGRPCEGSLQEQGPCVTACEASPCELSEWAEWGACSNQRLRLRNRTLLREAASGGAPCQGNLEEVAGCRLVDCEVSPWAEWSACDRACDGQQQRSRDVVVEPSMGGQCTRSLQETRGCSQDSCQDTYTLGDWEDWGACTDISCGIGRRQRRRSTCERSKDEGCKGTLAELQPCSTNGTVETSRRLHQSYGDEECPTPQDCAWGDWDEWSECSCSCNGGHHYRTREVVAMPSHGGRACEALSSEQAQPCNTQPCGSEHCADGEWDDWLSWAPCSSTCEGTTWRNRNLLREPDPCGRPAAGPSMQHASCNADIPCANHSRVDCRLAQWADWSDCDAACYGLARRHRTVEVHRRGGGEPCEGSLRQVRSCPNGPECAVDAPEDRDCSLSEWADWGACTNPCGGQRTRSRSVLLPPSGKGAPCEQGLALSALEPCEESQSCLSAPDVDCRWGSWGEWGACSGCDGQRQRSRHIEQVATGLGRPCEAAQSEEITNCTRSCHYVPGTFCGWVDWGPWTPCSATCGQGSRQRSRRLGTLHENSTLDMPAYIQKYDGLVARAERLRAHRLREILVAFVAGSLSVVAMLSAVQRAGSRWRCLQRRAEAVRVSLYNTVPEPVITAVQCVSNATRSFSRTSEFGHARYLALSTEDQDEGWFQGPAE